MSMYTHMDRKASDNARALAAQDRLIAGDAAALADIYRICASCALRMMRDQARKRGFRLAEADAREKAHNAAAYIAEQFLKRPGFRLKRPSGYVYCRVMHELYYRRKVDAMVEFRELTDRDFREGRQ